MRFSVTVERDETDPKTGPIAVGWFLANNKGGILYEPPERLTSRQTNKGHAKSASRCPAVVQMESRYFVVKCPFDLNIGFKRDDQGSSRATRPTARSRWSRRSERPRWRHIWSSFPVW